MRNTENYKNVKFIDDFLKAWLDLFQATKVVDIQYARKICSKNDKSFEFDSEWQK